MQKAVSPGSAEAVPSDAVLRRVRIPFIQRATLNHDGRDEELFLVDLGLAGAFAERDEPLPVGERVTVRFSLPGNDIPVTAACRVSWWNPPGERLASKNLPAGVGLEFVEVSEDDRARLRRHLVEYLHRESGNRRFHRSWPLAGEGREEPT